MSCGPRTPVSGSGLCSTGSLTNVKQTTLDVLCRAVLVLGTHVDCHSTSPGNLQALLACLVAPSKLPHTTVKHSPCTGRNGICGVHWCANCTALNEFWAKDTSEPAGENTTTHMATHVACAGSQKLHRTACTTVLHPGGCPNLTNSSNDNTLETTLKILTTHKPHTGRVDTAAGQ